MKFRKSLIVLLICLLPMAVVLKLVADSSTRTSTRLRAKLPGGAAVNIVELEDIAHADVHIIDGLGDLTLASAETPSRTIQFSLNDWTRVNLTGNANTYAWDPRITGGRDTLGRLSNDYPFITSSTLSAAIVWPMYHPLEQQIWNTSPRPSDAYYLMGKFHDPIYTNRDPLSPIQVMFRIPDDYRTGGTFKFVMHQDGTRRGSNVTTNLIRVGYRIFNTRGPYYEETFTAGNDWDAASYTQVVEVGTHGYDLSPVVVEMALSASDTAFAAGQWIAFQYWRIRDPGAVDELRHLLSAFQYEPEY